VSEKAAELKEDNMTTKSPANVPANDVQEPGAFDPNTAWDVALRDADQVLGHDLAKEEILDALEGVPFLITRMTFHPGEAGKREAFVSCEAALAPRPEMERRRVNLAMLPFDPGDLVVFNDGSTGIYRQCVAYLHARGFIALPDPVTTEGKGPRWDEKAGEMTYECSYDLPPARWESAHVGDFRYNLDGLAIYAVNVRVLAKRGIRISEYDNEWTQDGKTRYLA
jgi:hypothetical protein